jgi:TolB-like protein/tetratricopeptide (TPR) repeat protein
VFEDCVLDLDRRELSRPSGVIATAPKVFDLLVYLVMNRDRVVSRDDLLGAVWEGRIVSESTLASHINAVRKAIGDSGEHQKLVRTFARKGFRFVGDVRESPLSDIPSSRSARSPDPTATDGPAPNLSGKPSIAVLPFVNLSGDPEQDYFADGVVEDIIGVLSRFRWLFVIARNSSFTYKGRVVDVKQVGRELGVRYVLEGSVRKADDRVRITGQLVDATTAGHLWADRFEGGIGDVFDLQDQMAESIVGALLPQLEQAEIQRAKRKPTESLDSYDYYLRAMASFHRGTPEAIDVALPLFYRSIELDPDFAMAYGMAAWCHLWRKVNGWVTDGAEEGAEATRLACRAIDLGQNDPVALTRAGATLAHFGGNLDWCIALLDRAQLLNPNHAATWYIGGFLRIWYGKPEEAIERLKHAMRLSPLDSEMYRMQAGMALAHLLAGRLDKASSWAEKSFPELPSFLIVAAILAATYALSGRDEEARHAVHRMRKLNPALRISNMSDWLPFQRMEDLSLIADGLRKAGLPE